MSPVFPIRCCVPGQGLHEITERVREAVRESGVEEGLCTVTIQHTSASLIVQENADPSVQRDLEAWLDRLVPEGDPLYTHTLEGPDDMPAHVRSALTATSLSIPVEGGRLVTHTREVQREVARFLAGLGGF